MKRKLSDAPSRSPSAMAADALESPVPLAPKLIDLGVKTTNHLHRLVNRCTELVTLTLPAIDALDLGGPATHLGVDLLAQLALLAHRHGLHNELHAACFTDPILPIAVLAEVSPLPVATHEPVLIEEAHVSRAGRFLCCLGGLWLEMIGRGTSVAVG